MRHALAAVHRRYAGLIHARCKKTGHFWQARFGCAAMGKQHRGGGSDGNFTAALGVPTLDGLGCPGAGPHASHEHILWRELEPRVALMATLLEELE